MRRIRLALISLAFAVFLYFSLTPSLAAPPPEAVISVGPNSYGHSAPDTLERLQAAGVMLWRTDQAGTVLVTSNGTSYVMPSLAPNPVFLPLVNRSVPPTLTPTPLPTPATVPTAVPTIGPGSANPWGYNFTCCQLI